ncbi:hypothetical protein KP509_13G069700 [Ceratopteris richardii]|nr:hypothetical protein KP509_13G069700 [Ceratopteris richardii]
MEMDMNKSTQILKKIEENAPQNANNTADQSVASQRWLRRMSGFSFVLLTISITTYHAWNNVIARRGKNTSESDSKSSTSSVMASFSMLLFHPHAILKAYNIVKGFFTKTEGDAIGVAEKLKGLAKNVEVVAKSVEHISRQVEEEASEVENAMEKISKSR